MQLAIFGASGPTGRILVDDALAWGHEVRVVTRRPDAFAVQHERLKVFGADVEDGSSLRAVIEGCDAVASVLGTAYSRKPITVYSKGTRAIVDAMDATGCKRIVVVGSGLTYRPGPGYGFVFDELVVPLLHGVIGRTLYADMRAMEELLRARPDLQWTIMRPAELTDRDTEQPYRKEPDVPSRRHTTRRDLARAILDELDSSTDVHQAVAVSSY